MREIEFRGKMFHGFWVHGYYTKCRYNNAEGYEKIAHFINELDGHEDIDSPLEIKIETLGQYTGLKDKNGKKIFEGDCLRSGDDIMIVIFRKDLASFALSKQGWLHDHFFQEAVSNSECEIIGNQHDNPELLR